MSYTLSQKSITNYMQTCKNRTSGYKRIKSTPSGLLTLILLLTFNYLSHFTSHHYCNCAITQASEKAPPCWTPFKVHVPLFSEASLSTHLQRRQTQGKPLASADITSMKPRFEHTVCLQSAQFNHDQTQPLNRRKTHRTSPFFPFSLVKFACKPFPDTLLSVSVIKHWP